MDLDSIIQHIDGRYAGLIYVGRDYTLMDLVRDLKDIAEMHAGQIDAAYADRDF